ncbi:MAG: molybdenum cofactor guanylyltransferase [Pirellulales bacterium]
MQFGGIILCGGKSSRMGLPKATLPFGPELMLPRVARLLREVVVPVVVVAAPEQELPLLPDEIQIVRDRREGRGPLEGLLAGMSALAGQADAAYATSCDVPLLVPAFVQRVVERLQGHEIAVPRIEGYHHPLAAAYRISLLPKIEALLAADRLRPFYLFEQCNTLELAATDFADVDPRGESLLNLNHPADYLAALEQAGFGVPAEIAALIDAGEAKPPSRSQG